MKKSILLILALSTVMVTGCSKKSSNKTTSVSSTSVSSTSVTSTTSDKGTSNTPAHTHSYDVTGKCSCGSDLGKELTNDEAYGNGELVFDIHNQKSYFNFNSLCPTTFYIDECYYAVPSSTFEASFQPLIESIEIYKEGDLTTNLSTSLQLDRGVDDDGDEKYYKYESSKKLDKNSQYYVVLTFASDVTNFKAWVSLINFHYSDGKVWTDNEDHSKRHSTYTCDYCENVEQIDETYIYEVKLPSLNLEANKTIAENITTIVPQFKTASGGKLTIGISGCTGKSNSDLVVSGDTYELNFYIYALDDYCFSKTGTIVRDSSNTLLTPKEVFDYAINMSITVVAQ